MRHGKAQMPWGQYRGIRVRLIPSAYLSFLTTLPLMRDQKWKWLWDSVVAELRFRGLEYELAATDDPVIVIPDTPPPKIRKFRLSAS